MFVDTHCHLDCIVSMGQTKVYLTNEKMMAIKKIILDAQNAKVNLIANVGCDAQSSYNSIEIARHFKPVFALVGAHPYEGTDDWKSEFAAIKSIIRNRSNADKIVGVGEIGLDFSRKDHDKQAQYDLLRAQLELALQHNFPVSFHVRDAGDEFLEFLKPYSHELTGGVVHCFQQSLAFAKQVTKWGLMLGIDAPIGYPKNGHLREIIREIGLQSLVLETDSPFLPPQQDRGNLNYPHNIPLVAQEVATCLNLTLAEVATITTRNAWQLFALSALP